MRHALFFILLITALSSNAGLSEQPRDRFQFIPLVLSNKSIVLIRCDTATGEGWYRMGAKWTKGVEAHPIESSYYTCTAQAYGNNAWLLARTDQMTGRIWTLQGEVWRIILDAASTMDTRPEGQRLPEAPK